MHLQELKAKSPADLLAYAEELEIENASTLRKQDMMFAILKQLANNDVAIYGSGVLEVLSDGFGFLRAPESNYLPGPDDIYVSPSQVRRFSLRTGDTVEGEIRAPKDGERYFALLKVETINFSKPHTGKTFKVRFAKVHSGSAYAERTAVSEIKVYDATSDSYYVGKVDATTTLPEDNDGSYYASNLQDNLMDTPWCEGTEGSGEGEKLTYSFEGAKKISNVDVVNGNGTSFKLFMAYGSVKTLKLTFDNGKSQNLVLKPMFKPQTLNIEPVTTKSITVELIDVQNGKTVQDTCISELRFY